MYKKEDDNTICIYLDVYNDDFETKSNMCIQKNDTTSLSVIYYTIGNIQYKNQLKEITLDNLFKPLINQLNELNQNKIKLGNIFFRNFFC